MSAFEAKLESFVTVDHLQTCIEDMEKTLLNKITDIVQDWTQARNNTEISNQKVNSVTREQSEGSLTSI